MIKLNFKKYGEGATNLIILHGFLGSLDNWHTLASDWGKSGLNVYVLDQRNHGKSPHTDTHTIADMVNDLYNFMQQSHIDKAIILGHSMGGKVAMQFALSYPMHTQKLIVADMSPRAYKHGHDDVFNAIKSVELSHLQSRKEAEESMKPFLGDFGTRQFVLKNLERSEEGGYIWKFNFETLYKDYENILLETHANNKYNGPVLFIKGGLSLYIREHDDGMIKNLFPHAELAIIEEAGHWLHAEKPKAFYDLVLNFIIR
jgi:pimeloyl-ACP methyl ester carboxylesterase